MLLHIFTLIRKDLIVDWRQKHPIAGIFLYVVVTVYTVYLSFSAQVTPETWSVLYWIILLFIATASLAKTFIQEERRHLYYYYLVDPVTLILSKLVYAFLYLGTLGLFGLAIYAFLMGVPEFSLGLFVLNLLNGIIGLSVAFTMIAALAVRTNQKGSMMAILGFPVIMPVLLLAISNSRKIMQGAVWMEIDHQSFILLSVNAIILSLTLILFPYSWKG
jgi:heme exporter protein B